MLEALGLVERTVVHFDVSREDRDRRWAVHRLLHGRVVRRPANGRVNVYRYSGILQEGGIRLGQSVYLLPPELASRMMAGPRDLGVRFEWRDVYVAG